MEISCVNRDQNILGCTCKNTDCPRHGICCECLRAHRQGGSLVSCMKPENLQAPDAE